jgi:predicted nucleic acid-binding Zn ribbon protein
MLTEEKSEVMGNASDQAGLGVFEGKEDPHGTSRQAPLSSQATQPLTQCLNCGQTLEACKKGAKFCSDGCRWDYHNRKKKYAKQRITHDLTIDNYDKIAAVYY